jgi:hypothetical protein
VGKTLTERKVEKVLRMFYSRYSSGMIMVISNCEKIINLIEQNYLDKQPFTKVYDDETNKNQ